MINIKLSNCEVELKDNELTWGERELLSYYFISAYGDKNSINPDKLFETKVKRIEMAVSKIIKDGVVIDFNVDWLKSLPYEDGVKLQKAIDDIDSKKNITTQSQDKKLSESGS